VDPDLTRDLLMSPGDRIRIHMHDTPAGFRTALTDLTTGQRGAMTASVANGFGHILYTPNSSTCRAAPYAFHPEYSTAQPPWQHVVRPHLQRGDVGRDRAFRELLEARHGVQLAKHFRVIAPDARWSGRTVHSGGSIPYTLLADDVVALIAALGSTGR
jgi:hypothetical protein